MVGKYKSAGIDTALAERGATVRSHVVETGGGSIHVRRWPGDPGRTVVIWHGITGTGLDHVELAERLSEDGWQVLAPDSLGCGCSDWAADADTGYGLGALAPAAIAVLDRFDLDRVSWIGLSKGGGLGIRLAAEHPARLRALVLCDIGPGLPEAFRAGLASRLANPPRLATLSAFRAQVARMLARSGVAASDALVDRLSVAWARRLDDGAVGYHYDPALSRQFEHCPEDFDLWPAWDRVACPTLILNGEHSDVLAPADLLAMLRRNPAARNAELAGSGHVTFLTDRAHQDVLLAFLESVA